ncbi:unnamed protein product [Brachionus calyciflorus]|uniref:Uncharacterized protein n=1 Tax=Brachionus calyciflorus TaxID=104777 RepID=A0A814DBA4_9BILA|nr:unnamed protein product [Brachionus calyciflorus]
MSAKIHMEQKILTIKNQVIEISELEKKMSIEKDYLQKIQLIDCSITNLDEGLFKGLKNLKSLELDENLIKEIPAKIFTENSKLEKISFKNNNLKIVDLMSFSSLSKLKILDLSNNEISEIQNRFSRQNKNLINFEGNKIKTIDKKFFDNLRCSVLNLMNNPIEKIYFKEGFLREIKEIKLNNGYLENGFEKLILEYFPKVEKEEIRPQLLISNDSKINTVDRRNILIRLWLEHNKNKQNLMKHLNSAFCLSDFLIHFDFDLEIIRNLLNQKSEIKASNPLMLFYLYLNFKNQKFIDKILPLKSFIYGSFKNNSKYLDIVNEILNESKIKRPDIGEINNESEILYEKYSDFFNDINFVNCFAIVRKNEDENLFFYLTFLLKYVVFQNIKKDVSLQIKEIIKILEDWVDFEEIFVVFLFGFEQSLAARNKFEINLYQKTERVFLEYAIQEPKKPYYNIVEKVIENEWKKFPRDFYYMKLLLFIVFLTFFTIHVEKIDEKEDDLYGKISIFFLVFFFIIELMQFIAFIERKRFSNYLSSINNLYEIVNYIISIVAIFNFV